MEWHLVTRDTDPQCAASLSVPTPLPPPPVMEARVSRKFVLRVRREKTLPLGFCCSPRAPPETPPNPDPSLRCIGTFGHGTPVLTAFPFRKSSKYIDTWIEEYALT